MKDHWYSLARYKAGEWTIECQGCHDKFTAPRLGIAEALFDEHRIEAK